MSENTENHASEHHFCCYKHSGDERHQKRILQATYKLLKYYQSTKVDHTGLQEEKCEATLGTGLAKLAWSKELNGCSDGRMDFLRLGMDGSDGRMDGLDGRMDGFEQMWGETGFEDGWIG